MCEALRLLLHALRQRLALCLSSPAGTFNMDTPWLYVYTAHKLSQSQRHTLQLTSELTASKWVTIRNLLLEGLYRDKGREREARLKVYTPSVIYFQVRSRAAARAECSSDIRMVSSVHISTKAQQNEKEILYCIHSKSLHWFWWSSLE